MKTAHALAPLLLAIATGGVIAQTSAAAPATGATSATPATPTTPTTSATPATPATPVAAVAPAQTQSVATVAQALQAKDDTYIVLEGTVVRQIKRDKYEFRDATGTITVEVDDRHWPNRTPMLGARVRLHGEVERKLLRRTIKVDVDRVEPLS